MAVYDPDSGLVVDMVAGEDAHQTERTLAGMLLGYAEPRQVWVADRYFCTHALPDGLLRLAPASLCAGTAATPA